MDLAVALQSQQRLSQLKSVKSFQFQLKRSVKRTKANKKQYSKMLKAVLNSAAQAQQQAQQQAMTGGRRRRSKKCRKGLFGLW